MKYPFRMRTPPCTYLNASVQTTKFSFGPTIFKIGTLVSNSFNKLKLSSHFAIHTNLVPL
jgi:hypothetical protein